MMRGLRRLVLLSSKVVLLVGCQSDVVYLQYPKVTSVTTKMTTLYVDVQDIETDQNITSFNPPITDESDAASSVIIQAPAIAAQDEARIRQQFTAPLSCRVVVLQPAKLRTQEKKVLVQQGVIDYASTPAAMGSTPKLVQVMPARFSHEITPAVYKTIKEKIAVKREYKELYVEPATYRLVSKDYELAPAYWKWKTGCFVNTNSTQKAQADVLRASDSCLIRIPAKKQVLHQRLIERLPQFKWRTLPAEYVDVERQVVVTPGKGRGAIIPAQYRTLYIQHIAGRWSIRRIAHADRYQRLAIQSIESPSRLVAHTSLCQSEMNEHDVQTLQKQLIKASGQSLALSGKMDSPTQQALLRYQQREQLAQGAITVETLRALGF